MSNLFYNVKWELISSNGIYKWKSPSFYKNSIMYDSEIIYDPKRSSVPLIFNQSYMKNNEKPIVVQKELGVLINSTLYKDSRFNFNSPDFILKDLEEQISIGDRRKLSIDLVERGFANICDYGEVFKKMQEIAVKRLSRKKDIWF
ncbi:MAG: hypothetical protein ACOC1P_00770 [Minisyncoccales bacterium]